MKRAGIEIIRTLEDCDQLMERVRAAASLTQRLWMSAQSGDPLDILFRMKFQASGFDPIDHSPLNLVEQINQTWTYVAAITAARLLIGWHPEAGGFHLAPGAHAAQALDIMSVAPGLVGAEVFAAVDPENNKKLAKDLMKLAEQPETHRYVFFMSPLYPGTKERPQLEKHGIKVWSVDLTASAAAVRDTHV